MTLLGETLGMELQVEAVEQSVGSFRADIIARAIDETDPDSSPAALSAAPPPPPPP
jgi:hypothetical protein